MKRSLSSLLGFVALSLGACSSEVDLSGVYAVERHAADGQGCTNAIDVTDSPGAYVRFREQDLFGTKYYEWDWCSDAAGNDCPEYSGYTLYGEPIDGGWESAISLSSYAGDLCTVYSIRSTAVLDGDRLVIETRNHTGTFTTTSAGCDPELADDNADAMSCVQLEVIEAVAL